MGRVTILYASETGCAEEFAEQIGRSCERHGLEAAVLPMDEYSVQNLPVERYVVFVVSTTGQGEMPANGLRFWRFLLRKDLPKNSLSRTTVALCGLGDSGYKEFNFAAKKLYRRLLQLSASFLLEPAYGDDQSPKGPLQVLEPWLHQLSILLSTRLGGLSKVEPNVNQPPPSRYRVSLQTEDNSNDSTLQLYSLEGLAQNQEGPYGPKQPYVAALLSNERLSSEDWQQDVRHYAIQLDSSLQFQPGYSLAVLPRNNRDDVLSLLERLDLSPDQIIHSIEPRKTDYGGPKSLKHVPCPIRLYDLFQDYLDIRGEIRPYFFELLSHFAPADHEKERLVYFSTAEAQDEVRQYSRREWKNVREILEDFPSATPPLEYVLDLIPPLQARLFSIASSWHLQPQRAELLVATVRHVTPLKKTRYGLCTEYMRDLQAGKDLIRVWIKKGTPGFSLPSEPKTPILMIGPGTGLAPFRAFVQERVFLHRQGVLLGSSALYAGCRHREKDWCFGEEFNAYVAEEALTRYCVAFSRDQLEITNQKIYVQHLLREHSYQVWETIQQGGVIFLSGSSTNVPQSVKEALQEVIAKEAPMDAEAAEQYFLSLERAGRYRAETWS